MAVARYLLHWAAEADPEVIAAKQVGGRKALGAMERHLSSNDFLVGGRYSIADIALYAYTHNADEAGIDLGDFPHVAAWAERVAAQPGHVTIRE